MPTEKRRISITVEDWMWDRILKYRNDHNLMSMSNAVVSMMENYLISKGERVPTVDYSQVDEYFEEERRQKLKAELEKEIQKGHPHDADGEKLNS